MTQTQTYQIVLNQLSQVPASRMAEVWAFLDKIVQQKKRIPKILLAFGEIFQKKILQISRKS